MARLLRKWGAVGAASRLVPLLLLLCICADRAWCSPTTSSSASTRARTRSPDSLAGAAAAAADRSHHQHNEGKLLGRAAASLPWNSKGVGLLGLVAAAKARREEFRADLDTAARVALRKVAPAVCVCVGARQFGAKWVAERAGDKFRRQAALYLTIPAIAGVLNWATNKLAVWMIFNPESFAGIPFISRARPGEPLGFFGWQGIVPAKVRKMGGSIVDMTINELLDVRSIFSRVDPKKVADLMAIGGLLGALADAAEETGTLSPFFIGQARKKAAGGSSPVGAVMERRARKAVAGVISGVKADPLSHCALKNAVVDDMAQRRMLICELFQRCGRDEFRFIVDVGLWGGALLGVAQMAAWLVYTPKWSLVAGGALVGYATDYAALKVMFEPVNPWRPRWLAVPVERATGKEWAGFQGLFLTRQQAVSEEFAEFMAAKILSPRQIWSAILAPSVKEPCCPEQRSFEALLVHQLMSEAGPLIKGGEKGAVKLARALKPRLMAVSEGTDGYLAGRMQIEGELRGAMRKMSSERFESVLHPIFQEDELTLTLVGAALGGLAGYGQTFFY